MALSRERPATPCRVRARPLVGQGFAAIFLLDMESRLQYAQGVLTLRLADGGNRMKAVLHFPVMVGCKLSQADAAKLHALAAQTGLPREVVLRELVKRARWARR